MNIGFIGAGKVATAFGRYLHDKGLSVSGYYDLVPEKAAHAGERAQCGLFQSGAEAAANADIILITTQDDQITGACGLLCEQECIGPRHLVGHMSGAHSCLVLDEARKRGATVFSLHPLQAFADEENALASLPNTWFSLEGVKEDLGPIIEILSKTENPYFILSPEHKSLYHLSACIFSTYLVTLMGVGLSALEKAGIDSRDGFQAMLPLIEGTIANIAQLGPARALTGPIARGDAGTIARHLEALDKQGLDDLKSFYTFVGRETLELAVKEALKSTDKEAAVRQLLEEK
ncbi:MAG: DUF2520 domain-containing protein [Desulfobacterales bacterium]|nr:DUF2520 domain-containing protein [Desulfobacterales bacterium]